MSCKRFFLFLILTLLFFSVPFYAKEKTPCKNEVTKLQELANRLMLAGFYEKSLVKSRLALRQSILIKDYNLIANCYKTIAANFDELNEFEKAFFYYRISLIFANKTNNDNLKNKLYNNLGNIYCFDKKQYEKGILYYKKSLDYSIKLNDPIQNAFTKLNITWAYFDIGLFNDGLPYLEFINTYYKKQKDESTIVALNMLNGMYCNHINENNKANLFFQEAIRLGNEGNEKSDLAFSHLEYSKFLLKIGDYRNAYENLALYNSINDKLYDKEMLNKANVVGINLELDETKREIKKIESGYKQKQQLLEESQEKRQKLFLIIIGLLTLTGVLLYYFNQNSKLKLQNNLNEVQSRLQQNIINATMDGQEVERKKIASFLHDNISAKLSAACLHLFAFSAVSKIDSEEITKTKSILKDIHDEIRDLSHQLLPTPLAKFGLFYALQDLCENNSNAILKFKYSSAIPLNRRYNDDYETKIYFIIAELFNNILKHSDASKAKIILEEENNELIINISDKGKGFITNKFMKNEGFGLTQIRARISNMDGEFTVKSILNSGTFVKIRLPIQEKV